MKNLIISNSIYFDDLLQPKFILGFAALIAIVYLILVAKAKLRILAGKDQVMGWARQMGYRILKIEHRWVSQGPFSEWKDRQGYQVFYVELKDPDGTELAAFARCKGSRVAVIGEEQEEIEIEWVRSEK